MWYFGHSILGLVVADPLPFEVLSYFGLPLDDLTQEGCTRNVQEGILLIIKIACFSEQPVLTL